MIPFTSEKSENIIIVGDCSLSNVDKENGLVVLLVNSISLLIENKFLD